jgi:hypothetical protein
MTTQLQAINKMLTAIGQAPVVSLDIANPEISTALSILDSVNRKFKGKGGILILKSSTPLLLTLMMRCHSDNVLQLSDTNTRTFNSIKQY